MATNPKITDTTRQALKKIRKQTFDTLVDFGKTAVEFAVERTTEDWGGDPGPFSVGGKKHTRKGHRITGHLAESVQLEKKGSTGLRVVTTTGYGIHEEIRDGHEFIQPGIVRAIDDFHDQGKWD